jgi:molecular chaperone GrpE
MTSKTKKKDNTATGNRKKTTPGPTKKELIGELKELTKENEYLKDTLLRVRAELDNYRKRTEKEMSKIMENANADLIKKLLPIIDDLERSLDPEHAGRKDSEFYQGIELIYKNIMYILEEEGLEPMNSEGEPFEVELHDALMQVKKNGVESGVVIKEHQRGYLLNGRILRHAKVVVSE